MTTTNTYTLNSTTAHLLREGDVLTLSRTGEAYGVTTILPRGRGFAISVVDLRDKRPIYLEKASTFYGFEFTHIEETPAPAPEADPDPVTTYTISEGDDVQTFTDFIEARETLRDLLHSSAFARCEFEQYETTSANSLDRVPDLSEESFAGWCEFAADCFLSNAEDIGTQVFGHLFITAETEGLPSAPSAPSAPSEVTAATTPAHAYTIHRVEEFEYTGGGIWVTCGEALDTASGRVCFFDASICSSYAEAVNIYSVYPYEPDEEGAAGWSFMPLPNYDDLLVASYDPDECAEGRALWREILNSDLVRKGYVNAYRDEFLALVADPTEDAPVLRRDDSVTITRYTCGGGFFCDIEESADGFEAWLGHNDHAAREHMFGAPKVQSGCTYDRALFLLVVEPYLPEYIADYREEHLDEHLDG